MGITCILAMQKHSLMNQALITTLLTALPENNVVTSSASDVENLVAEIAELKPSVVLLGEATPLAAKDTLSHLLMCFPELSVIVVSEDTNWLHVFHKKDLLLTRQSDLLDIVYSQVQGANLGSSAA